MIHNQNSQWSDIIRLKEYQYNFERNVKNRFENKLKELGVENNLYFSVGAYIIENPTEKLDYMIDCTIKAKNVGKNTYGNTSVLFTEEIQKEQLKKQEIVSSMENAIKNEEFFIVVQPKVELETGKYVGGEVLVRWKKADGSVVYPDEFIPLFEANEFIVKLDYYVLKKTCAFIRDASINLPIISINVSASTMLHEDFISKEIEIVNLYGISPQQIEVELTESILDSDFKRITQIIKALKKLGFSIAIDDFGKGASSLARIRELDMDVLKLDKEFINSNVDNEKGKAVLSNIISMANDLGVKSLAEGIETKEQETLLVKLGCNLGQGYYFDKPLSEEAFINRIIENNEKYKIDSK